MRISFEKWLEDNKIPEEASALFAESITCYKISAYRSAFIMSYIAFQSVLKQRMLEAADVPNGIPESLWGTICSKLGDEDEWDKMVVECVKRTSPNRIFLISSSIVTEYDSYRVIRNKCAHGKDGKIYSCHVECFWNFIKDNFYKFVLNGGKTGIIKQIEEHYDRTITPLGADLQPIVNNIMVGVQDSDMEEFLDELYDFSESNNSALCGQFTNNDIIIELWDKLVNESDMRIHDAILNYIKEKKQDYICVFCGRYPSTVEEFLEDVSFARKLWTKLVFNAISNENGFWNIIEKIIYKSLIPNNEKGSFNKFLYKKIGMGFPTEKKAVLEKTDYFSRLRKELLSATKYGYPNGVNFANTYHYQFVKFVKVFKLDKESVACINQIFSFATYGSFYDDIRNLMKKESFLEQYRKIVAENDMENYEEKFSIE